MRETPPLSAVSRLCMNQRGRGSSRELVSLSALFPFVEVTWKKAYMSLSISFNFVLSAVQGFLLFWLTI